VDPRLRRALSQALRVEILERIASHPSSALQIAQQCGEPLARITYHLRILQDTGCIQPGLSSSDDPGEPVYEVTTLVSSSRRLGLSDSTRGYALASVLQRIVDSGVAALDAGTLGSREDNLACCESVLLDQQGWQETKAIADEANERLAAVRAASERRLAEGDEPGLRATIGFVAFETPDDP